MVSYWTVYGCRRPADADINPRTFQNDNANFHRDADQPANRDADYFVDACSNAYSDSQPDQDGNADTDSYPHAAADFNDAAFAHAAGDGHALAQPDQTCGDERALIWMLTC